MGMIFNEFYKTIKITHEGSRGASGVERLICAQKRAQRSTGENAGIPI